MGYESVWTKMMIKKELISIFHSLNNDNAFSFAIIADLVHLLNFK